MAAPGRTENPAVDQPEIARVLDREPFRFDFFQAVRLLERIAPERKPVGRFVNPSDEVARFGASPSLSFPASQIQNFTRPEGGPPMLRVNFMGLTGPSGVLPYAYTELIIERLRAKDRTLRDFLDIFNHRIVSLFYQAWEKYRFTVAYERGERDRFSHHLLDLIGLGTAGLQQRQQVPDDSLLYYCGLLGIETRSASAFRAILSDYFDAPVEIEQFVGAWYPADADTQCAVGEERGASEQLGMGAIVGDAVFDQQSRVRIRLGPLDYAQYREFLPGGDAWRALRSITGFFARGEFDVEVQLILRRDEVPACELDGGGEGAPRLGWSTWMKSKPFERDPGDTVLEL